MGYACSIQAMGAILVSTSSHVCLLWWAMIFHLVNTYEAKDKAESKRNKFAAASWQLLYRHGVVPNYVTCKDLPRTSCDIGDTRKLPFVKDLVDSLFTGDVNEDDVVLLTNMDTILSPTIITYCHPDALYYGCRRELDEDVKHLLTDDQINQLHLSNENSADVFIFSIGWWLRNKDRYPDMLLGCQWWDSAMIDLMISSGGRRIVNHIYHRNHQPFWFDPKHMFDNAGQKHNRDLAKAWNNPNPKSLFSKGFEWEKDMHIEFTKPKHVNRVVSGKATYYF